MVTVVLNACMKTNKEIRIENLLKLIEEMGTQKALAAKLKVTEPRINALKNGKPMGDDTARKLEELCGKEIGWMDHDHSVTRPSNILEFKPRQNSAEMIPFLNLPDGDELFIPKSNQIGAMGIGGEPVFQEVIEDWVTISRSWAEQRRIIRTKAENLAIIEGWGNSMKGVFDSGDLLIVDRGVNSAKVDGVYVFLFEGKVWIKTLQRMPGNAIQVISNNKDYSPFTIDESNGESFKVLAKVVWVWNGKAL